MKLVRLEELVCLFALAFVLAAVIYAWLAAMLKKKSVEESNAPPYFMICTLALACILFGVLYRLLA